MRIVFWQNIPSIHQSALLTALAGISSREVVLVAQDGVLASRVSLGWDSPDFGGVRTCASPSEDEISSLLASDSQSTVHIITGFRAYPLMRRVLAHCVANNLKFGVLTEIPNNIYGVAGIVKRLVYGVQAFRLRKKIGFVLAIGKDGVTWYTGCGYPGSRVFPFGYSVASPKVLRGDNSQIYRLVYVGQLIKRKGIDLLLKALSRIPAGEWCLAIVGDGVERQPLKKLAAKLGLESRVAFMGVCANEDTLRIIRNADLLVLPSRSDGWGAVVSEALMCGTPVLCSDRCGASMVIRENDNGSVFQSGSVKQLSKSLEYWMFERGETENGRQGIQRWAEASISGGAYAGFLLGILGHLYAGGPRPSEPWV
jgi:glycosyltransferase involved in cell wall biosynthesis